MITREEIDGLMLLMKSAYPNFHPEPGTPAVYQQLLEDLALDEIRAAVLACCGEPGRAFAPSVGEIRGAVMDIRRQARGLPSASQAWQEVHHSFFYPGEYSHPIIRQVVDRFGFRNLASSENEIADRAHFMKAYEQACDEAMQQDIQLPIVKKYIDEHRAPALASGEQIKRLAQAKAVK